MVQKFPKNKIQNLSSNNEISNFIKITTLNKNLVKSNIIKQNCENINEKNSTNFIIKERFNGKSIQELKDRKIKINK